MLEVVLIRVRQLEVDPIWGSLQTILKRNCLLRSFGGRIDNEVLSDHTIESIYQKIYPFTQESDVVKEEFNAEIDKGYTDMKEGKVRPASDVFADLQKDYGI